MDKSILYQGKKISYSIKGNGEPLVFLHGYLEYKEIWKEFTKYFENKYTILCIDLPGHGKSDTISPLVSMKEIARITKLIINTNSLEKVILIGHSMGGYISLAFANLFPEKLSGLILFSSSALNDSTEKKIARNRDINLIEDGKKDLVINNNIPNMFANRNINTFSSTIEHIKEIAKNMSNESIISALKGMKDRINHSKLLQESDFPKLFIAGKYDKLIQIDISKQQTQNCKNLKFEILESSGHMGYIEEEEKSAKIILDFISNLDIK